MIRWLLSLLRRRPDVELIAMRLVDMHFVHPEQITARCSACGEEVGVYPSGQRVMREVPGVKLLCQVCRWPCPTAMPAPGASLEPMQSVRKAKKDSNT